MFEMSIYLRSFGRSNAGPLSEKDLQDQRQSSPCGESL